MTETGPLVVWLSSSGEEGGVVVVDDCCWSADAFALGVSFSVVGVFVSTDVMIVVDGGGLGDSGDERTFNGKDDLEMVILYPKRILFGLGCWVQVWWAFTLVLDLTTLYRITRENRITHSHKGKGVEHTHRHKS